MNWLSACEGLSPSSATEKPENTKLALDKPLTREYSCGSLMGDRWRVRMKLTAFGEIPNRLGIREGITLPSRLCYFPSEPTSTNP